MKWFAISLAGFLLLGALSLATVLKIGGRDLPSPAHLQAITPATKTRVLDREGRLIGEFYRENRVMVQLDDIPEDLVQAFIAVEDRKFWNHWGISLSSVARATIKNVASLRVREGASTITQQLARNLFLTHEKTASRKIKEAVLAIRIEQNYSKDEILEMYLNQIYFGDGAYGVQAAARRYLGKNVKDLSVGECALLAGLPRNPRYYSPHRHKDAALKRRNVVLRSMRECGFITPEEASAAAKDTLNVAAAPLSPDNAPYFMEMVRLYLEKEYGSEAIYEGGLTVYTTLNLPLQQETERIVEDLLTGLEKTTKAKYTRADYLIAAENGDSPPMDYLQGSALVADNETGGILALVGGRSFEESNFNRVTRGMRQPGSAFKPFIYLAAIEKGFYPSYTVMDAPVVYDEKGQKPWRPRNYDRQFHGPVTLRYALQRSLNVPTIKIQEEVGTAAVIQKARAAGIETPIPAFRSIALGTAEVTLNDLTYAYAVFANGGIRVDPLFLTRIEDRSGNLLKSFRPQKREVLQAAPVAILNSMLASVLDNGTGSGARRNGFKLPGGGKTGTTDEYSDAWFIGYTPSITAGVWVGYDKPKPIGRGMSGTKAALPIWTRVMKAATKDAQPQKLELTEGVVTREVCSETGLPSVPECPTTTRELFLAGKVPTERCYLHTTAFDLRGGDRWDSLRQPKDWGQQQEEKRRLRDPGGN